MQTNFQSPLGIIQITGTESHIQSIQFVDKELSVGLTQSHPDTSNEDWILGKQAKKQLEEYFSGKRAVINLSLQPQGTEFQQAVWKALQEIPFGETRSYGDIAKAIGKPNAARAIGQANNRNPIAIVIPCHRVIGSNKKITGYAGGIWRKEFLLKLESCKTY